MTAVPAIRRERRVPGAPDIAFAVFTDGIGRWWPLAEFGVYHDGAVAIVDGRIVETAADGREATWGTVTTWEPPARIAFTWHPGAPAERASRVEVTFVPAGADTIVTLTHNGWEVFADPQAAREEYDHGWPAVLDRFAGSVAAAAGSEPDSGGEETEWSWVALMHTRRPEITGSVFADPRFAHHVAFLQTMAARDYLVAAGSFEDAMGEGMTVLRLPGADGLPQARELAEADGSVAQGLFDVRVRPWNVVMSALPSRQ